MASLLVDRGTGPEIRDSIEIVAERVSGHGSAPDVDLVEGVCVAEPLRPFPSSRVASLPDARDGLQFRARRGSDGALAPLRALRRPGPRLSYPCFWNTSR
jgi:hypothetical protein